jgi:hypothetical protein
VLGDEGVVEGVEVQSGVLGVLGGVGHA